MHKVLEKRGYDCVDSNTIGIKRQNNHISSKKCTTKWLLALIINLLVVIAIYIVIYICSSVSTWRIFGSKNEPWSRIWKYRFYTYGQSPEQEGHLDSDLLATNISKAAPTHITVYQLIIMYMFMSNKQLKTLAICKI